MKHCNSQIRLDFLNYSVIAINFNHINLHNFRTFWHMSIFLHIDPHEMTLITIPNLISYLQLVTLFESVMEQYSNIYIYI